MNRHANIPMAKEEAASLEAGGYVCLAETIYTAGDTAYERMDRVLNRGKSLSFNIEGSIIYYMGPSPTRKGRTIGPAGPTTASRMNKYTPRLLGLGMGAMIGRGERSEAVMDAIMRNGAVYFAAMGGAEAILPKCILSSEIVAYGDLGTEAARRLTIQDFPVVVMMDALGNNLCEAAVKEFCTLQRGDMKRIIYMVPMNLPHAPIWFFTVSRVAREEGTRIATRKYGYISEMVKRISKGGRVVVTATGTEHIPSQDGFILFPNHQGLFDILALFSTCPRPLFVVIKKEASNWILVKQILGATESLAMDRGDIKDQVRIITEVTKRVESDRSFVIFAEGHRSRNGDEILNFKGSTFKNAIKAGCPIVPVALVNSFRPFGMNSSKREEVQVHYIEPILPDQYMGVRTSEIAHPVHNRIQEEINRNLTKNSLTS